MKIACISLGCPKNQVDLDVMVHILLSAGHETVADLGEADVILVNTCGFIESAKTEAIENILEACAYKQQNPELKVIVAGSYVQDGKITSNCQLRLIRDGIVIHEGKIASLRRFKDDVKEVAAGFECGIAIDSYRDVKEGDQLESFELKEEAAELK